jgi:RecA-family ATPase
VPTAVAPTRSSRQNAPFRGTDTGLTSLAERISHFGHAEEPRPRVLLVQKAASVRVQLALASRFVVQAGTRQSCQLHCRVTLSSECPASIPEKLQDNPSKPKRPCGVLSLGQLLQHRPTPSAALIEPGLLPDSGILFVGGEPKVGKSILVANLALALASGRSRAGFEARQPERVCR